jgi:hypothetical protein
MLQGFQKLGQAKIMRRILRKIAEGDLSNLGDTTTLADPSVVESLISKTTKPMTRLLMPLLVFVIFGVVSCSMSPRKVRRATTDE